MSNIANFPILYQYERGNKVPIDLHSSFSTMDAALTYLRAYKNINVYAGLLISIGTGEDVKLYIVKSNSSGEYRLEETGGSVKKVATKEEMDAFATSDNIGKQFYLTSEVTIGSGESLEKYTVGLYVITGATSYQKLATASASGDLASDVGKLLGKVGDLETSLGDNNTGLIKKVNDLDSSVVKTLRINNSTQLTPSQGILDLDLSNYALKTDISSVYKFISTVDKYADLPTTNIAVGDVYNVTAAFTLDSKYYPAGTNVAWNGNAWDPLGGELDLSNYFNKDEVTLAISTSVSEIEYLNGLTINDKSYEATAGGSGLVLNTESELNVTLSEAGEFTLGLSEDFKTAALKEEIHILSVKFGTGGVARGQRITEEQYQEIQTAVENNIPIYGYINGKNMLLSYDIMDTDGFVLRGVFGLEYYLAVVEHASNHSVLSVDQGSFAKQGTLEDASTNETFYGLRNRVNELSANLEWNDVE